MNPCLINLCKEFEPLRGFLHDPAAHKQQQVRRLFLEFMRCFSSIQEEKLRFPREFQNDVRLFNAGDGPTIRKFEDVQLQYLLLSDFYDYCRLSKRI